VVNKIFCSVNSPADVPEGYRVKMFVVRPEFLLDIVQRFDGQTSLMVLYLPEGVSQDDVLKLVEDYEGPLVCFSPILLGPVLRSRFSQVRSMVVPEVDKAFGGKGEVEVLLDQVKRLYL